ATTLVGNTTTDSATPTGTSFGFNGTAETTIVGAFVANFYTNGIGATSLGLQWTDTIGSTDGHATGAYTFTAPLTVQPDGGGIVAGISWATNSTTLHGDFSKAAVGDGLAISAGTGTGI
ncbi:MAG: hypothetical protein P4L86_08465, partial [Mycobacterium sp.]|nr:hypothetical protein [Mycobacterium sp.]